MERPTTFNLGTVALASANCYERLVDERAVPYFNVFWDQPSVAVHDWPDFGDVTARQLQAAVMLRRMTGRRVATEDAWLGNLRSWISAEDGLLHRPTTPWSPAAVADWGDAALTLYALATAFADSADPELGRVVEAMTERLCARAAAGDPPREFRGFILKSLMLVARLLGNAAALELAGRIVGDVFGDERMFTRDNRLPPGSHMHGSLRALVGALDYALYTGDDGLRDRIDALYRWVRGIGTSFGFLPEVYARSGDIVACETCALMDWAGLGVTLANDGATRLWGDMERLARNHFAESLLTDAAWLTGEVPRAFASGEVPRAFASGVVAETADSAQCTWRDLASRMAGAWAGWSSPNHFLAARETLNAHWTGPELADRTRALQNCCAGSGVHGLFILWKNASRCLDRTLWVNMHVDKLLPHAEIRCFKPWRGLTRVTIRRVCDLRVRVPDFASRNALRVTRDGAAISPDAFGEYLGIENCAPGQVVEIAYPLPIRREEVSVGNPGRRQYRYRVEWKGDTVVVMEPLGNDEPTGWSEFDKAEVPVFYGREGPGPLYLRAHMRSEAEPGLDPLHEDDGALDFWRL
jgi:hypothetical protein